MQTYYEVTAGEKSENQENWKSAKACASAALKKGIFPIEIVQRTMIDGTSPHYRRLVCIEAQDGVTQIPSKEEAIEYNPWECISSFHSHIHPSANL